MSDYHVRLCFTEVESECCRDVELLLGIKLSLDTSFLWVIPAMRSMISVESSLLVVAVNCGTILAHLFSQRWPRL